MRGRNAARPPLLFTAGELMVERHARHPDYLGVGGAAANAAVAFVRAGGRAAFACRLAEDEHLPLLESELERVGLWSPAVVLGGPFNAVYTIGADCPYGRFGYAREGSAGGSLAPEDLDGGRVAEADVVLVSGVFASLNPTTRATVRRILDLAAPVTVVAYDVNHRPALASPEEARALYEELSPSLTLVKADLEEGRLLWGGDDAIDVSRRGASRHPLVMLTLGADGLVLVADGETVTVPATPAECVDPTGAGDAALGTALFHLARGRSPGEIGRAAADAGARCVGSLGAWGYTVGNRS
jgi:2-dehydro-3-deoxygluconokinase